MKKFAFIIFWISFSTLAQTNELDQLHEIERQNIIKSREIGKMIAENNIKLFFIERANRIAGLAKECFALASRLDASLTKLNDRHQLDETLKFIDKPLDYIHALSLWLSQDLLNSNEAAEINQQIKKTQVLIANNMSQMGLTPLQLYSMYQPPKEIWDHAYYTENLKKAFDASKLVFLPDLTLLADSCYKNNFPIESNLELRRQRLNTLFSNITTKYTEKMAAALKQSFQNDLELPKDFANLVNVRRVLSKLEQSYNHAILVRSDYYLARSLLESFEHIGPLFSRILGPVSTSQDLQKQIQSEIDSKSALVKKAYAHLAQFSPSTWLSKRHGIISSDIASGKIACAGPCKTLLKEADQLIGAASVLETSNDNNFFALLANHALDQVEGKK